MLLDRMPMWFQLKLGRWWMDNISRQHGPKGLRKQVTDLTPEDLRETPVWEYALDEEGEPGQDEETLRPCPGVEKVDPKKGIFVVATSFQAADGTRFSGFATPVVTEEDHSEQPTIITDTGFVNFWRGMAFDERKLDEAIAAGYDALKRSPAELFPLHWEMGVRVKGGSSKGELRGFGYLRKLSRSSWSEDWKT